MGSTTAPELVQSHALLTSCPGLRACLDAAPSLKFSAKGRANLCRRFHLTDAELTAALAAYHSAS